MVSVKINVPKECVMGSLLSYAFQFTTVYSTPYDNELHDSSKIYVLVDSPGLLSFLKLFLLLRCKSTMMIKKVYVVFHDLLYNLQHALNISFVHLYNIKSYNA